jgi:Tol biopolymer transport system component
VKASPATIGEPADWQKAYDGLNVPETKHPPRLGVPSEAGVRRGVIAFERDGGVFLFDFAGERETALTAGFRPVFFHDGERLAFVRGADPAERRIVSIDLRTRKERILSGPICDRSSLELAISPDDRLIAYVAGLGGASDDRAEELHLLDVASGRDEAVGSAEEEISDLAFAPDGRELYVVASGTFMRRRLAVLDVETRLVGRLPEHAEELLQSPQRIGARLLVSAGPMRAMCCLRSDLFTSDLTGVERTRLGTFGMYGYMQARVSPAERFIALSWSARQGGAGADWHDGITVVAADGSDPHDLTAAFPRPFYTAHHPTWAPDDHHVAFTLVIAPYSGSGVGLATIVVADAAEPNKRLVALATGTRAEWQPAPRTFDGRLAVEPSR